MKVVAFNGSARKDGNTAILVRYVLSELEKEGIETEFVQLAGKRFTAASPASNAVTIDKTVAVDNDDRQRVY